MKKLKIPLLSALDTMEINVAGDFLIKNTDTHAIEALNWPESFDYLPDAKFNIASTDTHLWIHFRVLEGFVKAVHLNDQEEVWKDSCVEFFVKLPYAEKYTNFEFNCIGTCLSTRRKSRNEEVVPLSVEEMQSIERYATLGNQPVDLEQATNWALTVKIPMQILSSDTSTPINKMYANFYKCGDGTAKPHYVSWNNITTPQPDFHRPEFFGMLEF